MAEYSISIDAAGSRKDNEQSRNINALFPYDGNTYKTIESITRRGGIWCNCGGTSQNVVLSVYDQMLDDSVVIKTSDVMDCKCYGRGPGDENYAQTSFTNWTQAESNAAIRAWEAGTLIIKRFVTIKSYSSSKHGTPVFRDGFYKDEVSIVGTTVPFTQYGPTIALFDVMRSDDGIEENPESTSVFAKIRLNMLDMEGMADHPELRVYYSVDVDPTLQNNYLDIGSAFGLSAENLNTEKTVQLSGEWNAGTDYYFMLYFSAGDEVAPEKRDAAMRAAIPLYIAENNNGVAVGQYSSATDEEPKFECKWPAYLYGGIAQIGEGNGSLLELMGIQTGSVAAQSVPNSNTVEVNVPFSKAYKEAPMVIVNIASVDTHYYIGRCNVAITGITASGFAARIANGGGDPLNIGFTWAAFGILA